MRKSSQLWSHSTTEREYISRTPTRRERALSGTATNVSKPSLVNEDRRRCRFIRSGSDAYSTCGRDIAPSTGIR